MSYSKVQWCLDESVRRRLMPEETTRIFLHSKTSEECETKVQERLSAKKQGEEWVRQTRAALRKAEGK